MLELLIYFWFPKQKWNCTTAQIENNSTKKERIRLVNQLDGKISYTVYYNNVNRSTSNQCAHKAECLLSTVSLRKE